MVFSYHCLPCTTTTWYNTIFDTSKCHFVFVFVPICPHIDTPTSTLKHQHMHTKQTEIIHKRIRSGQQQYFSEFDTFGAFVFLLHRERQLRDREKGGERERNKSTKVTLTHMPTRTHTSEVRKSRRFIKNCSHDDDDDYNGDGKL